MVDWLTFKFFFFLKERDGKSPKSGTSMLSLPLDVIFVILSPEARVCVDGGGSRAWFPLRPRAAFKVQWPLWPPQVVARV